MSKENWAVVTQASGDLEAEIIRGMLEAQGIPVVLLSEGAGRAIGISIGELGQVDILVPKDTLERAQALLAEYYAPNDDPDSPDAEDDLDLDEGDLD